LKSMSCSSVNFTGFSEQRSFSIFNAEICWTSNVQEAGSLEWQMETWLDVGLSRRRGVLYSSRCFLLGSCRLTYFQSWIWRRYVPPKWRTSIGMQAVRAQKTLVLIVTDLRTSNLTMEIKPTHFAFSVLISYKPCKKYKAIPVTGRGGL
jgi:hypothetical protein